MGLSSLVYTNVSFLSYIPLSIQTPVNNVHVHPPYMNKVTYTDQLDFTTLIIEETFWLLDYSLDY